MSLRGLPASYVLASIVVAALAALGARPFAGSWARALVVGIPVLGAMLLLGLHGRRRTARALEKEFGRLTVRGPILTFEQPPGTVSSVHASAVRELWYQYSIFGWSGANNWALVHDGEQARSSITIYEVGARHLLEPLREWSIANLPGFDPATFDRIAWSVGDDEQPNVLVWARRDP